MSTQECTRFVQEQGARLGFVRVGVTGTQTPQSYPAYRHWLEQKFHGSMHYMDDAFHKEARQNMHALLPEVQSAIVVALNYAPVKDTARNDKSTEEELQGRVAAYALGNDYHRVLKEKLYALAESLDSQCGVHKHRACVDSAPLLERELARRAGLGFIAKNTMLITPGLGSYTLLGVLLTSLPLEPTPALGSQHCGTCTACLDACPTQAFSAPYQLDARKCISYLTIESETSFPLEVRESVGTHIFGCDICQNVCPYNAKAPLRNPPAPELAPIDATRAHPSLAQLANQGSNQRKRYVHGTPLRRNRNTQMLRNVAVALGNLPTSPKRSELLHKLADHPSPLVQEHARWALATKTKKKS